MNTYPLHVIIPKEAEFPFLANSSIINIHNNYSWCVVPRPLSFFALDLIIARVLSTMVIPCNNL
jgi:hypothetical protein